MSSHAAPPVSTASNACTPEKIFDCETLKKAPMDLSGTLGFSKTRDGSIVFNSFGVMSRMRPDDLIHPFTPADESALERLTAPSPALRKRALDVAEQVRREAIALVKGDVRDEALTETQRKERDALVKKLETIRFTFVDAMDKKCSVENPAGFPNASYRPFTHTVELCPSVAHQSSQAIVRALAHELGHPLAPCNATDTVYKVNAALANRETLRDCDPDFVSSEDGGYSSLHPEYVIHLAQLADGRLTHMSASNDSVVSALASCGVLTPLPEASPVTAASFATTQACVERSNASRHQTLIDALIEDGQRKGLSRNAAEATARQNEPAKCFPRTQEDFADAFAARLLDKIAEKSRYSTQQVKAAVVEFAGYACNARSGGFEDTFIYAPMESRLRVFTSGPYVSARLGCEPPRANDPMHCPLRSVTITETSPAATTPSKSGKARR